MSQKRYVKNFLDRVSSVLCMVRTGRKGADCYVFGFIYPDRCRRQLNVDQWNAS